MGLAEILPKDSDTDQDEKYPACESGSKTQKITEFLADVYTKGTAEEGNTSDDQGGGCNIDLHRSKADTDSKSIDTGSYPLHNQILRREYRCEGTELIGMPLLPESLMYHIDADGSKQEEGNIILITADPVRKGSAQKETENGHKGLKESEGQGGSQNILLRKLIAANTVCDRDCESICSQAEGNQDACDEIHSYDPFRKYILHIFMNDPGQCYIV